MKLFIQVPCLNEEKTLPAVIAELPRAIDGVDEIYTLVIDDGSTDRTAEVAQEIGVDYILKNAGNCGLAQTFAKGIDVCLLLGADLILNTDGDNQYCGANIPQLVAPLLENRADIVIGCRDVANHAEFSGLKKFLHQFGSHVVNRLANVSVPDVTSGFRALNRRAAMHLIMMTMFSYTIEMLIQAGRRGLRLFWVPIQVNPATRPSRLFRSKRHFIIMQIKTILKVYLYYCPMRFFGWLVAFLVTVALLSFARLSYYLWFVDGDFAKFKIGSGLLLLFSLLLAVIFIVSGLLGQIMTGQRYVMEDIRYRIINNQDNQNRLLAEYHLITAPQFFRWKSYQYSPESRQTLST
ncbi:MAG: glycosyltransferase family 2 protein [Desulfobaccales bacterium]